MPKLALKMRFWGRRRGMGRTLNRTTTATHCNTLQHVEDFERDINCNTLQHTVSHCITLQHTAARGGL